MLNKVLAQIAIQGSEIFAPEHWWGPKKVPKIFFEADFGGFAVILRIHSKLQKVIILGALRDSFEILRKSLTIFEILEKGYFAPWGRP